MEEPGQNQLYFFKCVLRKQNEKIKHAFYQDMLVFFTFKNIKKVCVFNSLLRCISFLC